MKFITEYDLRAQFNEQPFTDYQMEEDTRLTPGARQFLSDRRIHLLEDGTKMRSGVPDGSSKAQETKQKLMPASNLPSKVTDRKENSLEIAKLMSNMEILEAEFLVITSQIIEENIEIAGQVAKAGHEFSRIKSILTDETADPDICFEGCTGMNVKNCCQDLGDCFEISDFYIQSANGKAIVWINALRAKIRAVRIQVAEVLSGSEDGKRFLAVTEAVNQIINKLSQLICLAAGVKECRRTK